MSETHVLENVTEWHVAVQVSVEVAVDDEGGILPVRAWFEGRELAAGELEEIDVGRIHAAIEKLPPQKPAERRPLPRG